MSDLSRLQTAEPVLVTDGTNQATFGTSTPAGTESGMIVRDAVKGQATMANSRPVVVASDQSTLPVAFASTDTYGAATLISASLSLTASGTTSLGYLWHPASVTKRYELQRITLSTNSGTANTTFCVKVTRITAEAGTPGGSTLTPLAFNGASAASGATLRISPTGAPTRASTDVFVRTILASASNTNLLEVAYDITPLLCRASVAEGWEVRLVNDSVAISGMRVALQFIWVEI